jgi:hypothetical protein
VWTIGEQRPVAQEADIAPEREASLTNRRPLSARSPGVDEAPTSEVGPKRKGNAG